MFSAPESPVLKYAHVWGGRVWAFVGVPLLGALAAVGLFGGPGHWPQDALGVAIVAVVLIVLFYRFWRMGVRFDDNGVKICGFLRTDRFGWPEVSHFADGRTTVSGGESSAEVWALAVVLHGGRTVTVSATAGRGPSPKVLAAIGQVAARYQIPAELTGLLASDLRAPTPDSVRNKAATGFSDTGADRGSRARQVGWALVPIVSLTVLAWWPFLVLALIRRWAQDWVVFAAYLAAVAAEIVVLTLVGAGIIPAVGVAADVAAIIFSLLVTLVALTAPVYTLVAFRPTARLPSLSDAARARC